MHQLHTYIQTDKHTYNSLQVHTIPYHSIPSIPFTTIPYHSTSLHYIPFHFVALHTITYHFITYHYSTYRYITVHSIVMHCIALHTIPYRNVCMYTCRIHYTTKLCIHTYHTSVHLKYLSIYNGHIYIILYFSLLHLSTLLRWQIMLKCSLATPRLLESRGSDGP